MCSDKRNMSKVVFILLIGLNSHSAFSGDIDNELTLRSNLSSRAFVTTLSVGPLWKNGGNSETLLLTPDIEKSYTSDTSNGAFVGGELFFGIQQPLNDTFQGQLGFAVAATGNATFSGDILDDANPEFNNYSYEYKVRHTYLGVKSKLLANTKYPISPWISGSIGISYNQSHDFSSEPKIFEALPTASFPNNTESAFSYTLGVGLQYVFTEDWQFGVSYEFADWGKNQLGKTAGQTLEDGLGSSHLFTHGFLANITYLGFGRTK